MEAVAAAAAVSKRTLYKRYPDKAALLHAAIEHLIQNWLPPFQQATTAADTIQAALEQAARTILAVALTPEALALHRLMIAEGLRFPELARIMQQAGTNLGITRIAALLERHALLDAPSTWAAEQFQRLVLTGPQQRALGLGDPLSPAELEDWVVRSVRLFLRGIQQKQT